MVYVLIGYLMQIFAFFGCFILPESPKFLIEQNNLVGARKSLEKIAKWNKKQLIFNENDFGSRNPMLYTIEISNLPNVIEKEEVKNFIYKKIGHLYKNNINFCE